MPGGSAVRWRKAAGDDAVRLVVGQPRRIPRRRREEVAVILAQELLSAREVVDARRHAARYGAFHMILGVMRETAEWEELRTMAARSDVAAALALRSITAVALDLLDRSYQVPGDGEEVRCLSRLIALTVASWQRQPAVGREEVLKAVDELEATDALGRARYALRQAIILRLAPVVEEVGAYLRMMAMLEQLLPPGTDEVSVEEALTAYLGSIDRLAELLERSKELQRIIDLMGQLDVEYGSKREKVHSFSTSEAYALGLSKDVRHMLPVELLKLKVPILRTLFFSQMVEGELLTYELRGLNWSASPERRRRGPVVALIDASGSMSGEPEILAKAMIMMLVRRMAREKREVKIILFAATDCTYELDLSDRKSMARDLLDILSRQFEGGTDFNSALRVGLSTVKGKRWRGADVLLFTDGMSILSDQELVREWAEFKRRTASHIYTLIVGNSSSGGLEKVSDSTYLLSMERWDIEGSPSNIVRLMVTG